MNDQTELTGAPTEAGAPAPARAFDARRRDVVVVGGGHNGLTCAAYLARAGLDVLVVEARDTVGGCASTLDVLGGARVNVCNCDHSMVRSTGVIEELDLASHGLRYLELEPAQTMVPWDGSSPWMLFGDRDRTLQSLALVRPRQVGNYQRYLDDLLPAAELVLAMTSSAPEARTVAARLIRRRGRGLRQLLRLSRLSCAEVLAGYFDDESLLTGAATSGPAVWGLPPETPGTGLGALGYALRHLMPVGRPAGGSGVLTDALARAVQAAGGTILTGARVAEIRVEGGRAAGIALADGTRIDAATVISAGDPRAALVDLLQRPGRGTAGAAASATTSRAARRLVQRWEKRGGGEGYESKIDAVVSEPPRLRGLEDAHLEVLGVGQDTATTFVITPSSIGLRAAADAARAGRVVDRPPMLANTPSVLDPSVAPPGGGHVFSLEVLFTPYALHGGWGSSAEPDRWLKMFSGLVQPGFLDGLTGHIVTSPADYERDFSMPRGYAPSYAGGPLSALFGRDRELTRYATPLGGLYLTGAGTFPGAGVSGAPGRNAAHVVLEALGR